MLTNKTTQVSDRLTPNAASKNRVHQSEVENIDSTGQAQETFDPSVNWTEKERRPAEDFYATPVAKKMESFFTLMPREILAHRYAPKTPAEMIKKLLAPPQAAQEAVLPSPLEGVGKLMTVAEVSRLLQCSSKSVWNKLKKGELQSFKTGRVVRIPESSIAALLTRREV
jgi:excisionase family DNA binding protein